jgi:glycosyltransferase involved in cell wall biosynthesis
MKKKISVVIVTHNRQKDVMELIKSLLDQTLKPFEIIIIDDGSNPPLNVDCENEMLKIIRFDKEIGLSSARNYGVKISRGDYIAFIDDDAIADVNWLKEIQRGIRTGTEVLGGPLKPLFKASPPEWWNEKDFGGYAGVGNWGRIWGCNMIISKIIFEKVGLFRAEIGRQKGKLLSGEDDDLLRRAINKGYSVLFLPRAIVYHKVSPQRMTLRYILKWEYFYGKSIRKKNGYRPLNTLCLLFINLLNMANPRVIFSKKIDRIRKIAWLAQLLGQLV